MSFAIKSAQRSTVNLLLESHEVNLPVESHGEIHSFDLPASALLCYGITGGLLLPDGFCFVCSLTRTKARQAGMGFLGWVVCLILLNEVISLQKRTLSLGVIHGFYDS